MQDKTSNRASIVVALVAIILILGAIFLLNQSLNSPRNGGRTAEDTDSLIEEEDNDEDLEIDEFEEENTVPDPVLPNREDREEPEEEQATEPEEETTEPEEEEITTETPNVNVQSNQLTARALNVASDGMVDFEIINCGVPNATYCKAGNKMKLSLTRFNITQGSNYLITGNITDGSDGFRMTVTALEKI